ncbi:MAG: arsenite methyltransferase [Actinomycetota bacterium]|nr:arsenite methyltransferase [Actinomycetota bacterium]
MDEVREEVREEVRAHYARAARSATAGGCSDACCSSEAGAADSSLYGAAEREFLPEAAVLASLGCGNPTAVAELREGETVLDLGSGGGIDVLLSARRVGPTGKVYGLDMTEEMLALALRNKEEAGATNVEFLRGYIEDIPLPAATVDVVISNCVINLSADKGRVFAEMARVLRPGGRVGVSDIVAEDDLTPDRRAERGSHVGCIAGALSFREYEQGLRTAGFEDVTLTPTHQVAEGMHSVIIRATKGSTPGELLRRMELSVVRQPCC